MGRHMSASIFLILSAYIGTVSTVSLSIILFCHVLSSASANSKSGFDVVFDAVRSGLDCMHEAGYMHGDLKPDNVLFEDFDADGCPKGIQLADFGLSHELGKPHMKFPKQYYNISWHEAGTVFNGVTDPFKLTTKVKVNGKYKMHYVVDSRLDECSFAMLMYELFNERVPSIQEHLGKGACGPMGPERGLMMP